MSIINKALNILGLQKSIDIDRKVRQAMLDYVGGGSPIAIPDNLDSYIKNGYNKNIFVYMVISYIASKAADIPWQLKRWDGSKYVDVQEHPLYDLIEQPNELTDWSDLVQQAIGFLLITGNSYLYNVAPENGTNKGKSKELYTLPAQFMEAITGDSATAAIKAWKMYIGREVEFSTEEIMHVKLPNYDWVNGQNVYGQSPLKAGLQVLNKSNSNIQAQASQAQNGGAKGVLMYDRGTNMQGELTDPQLRILQNKIRTQINGDSKRGSVVGLGQLFKYQQLGLSSKDMQLIDDHNVSRQDIAALYGLSSILFNDNSSSTYNNILEVKKSAYTDSILPYLNKFMSEFNRTIVSKYDKNLRFFPDTSDIDVLQADKKEQVEWLSKAWWISSSRKLEIMGESEKGTDLPEYLIPSNLIPSEEVDFENIKSFGDYEK